MEPTDAMPGFKSLRAILSRLLPAVSSGSEQVSTSAGIRQQTQEPFNRLNADESRLFRIVDIGSGGTDQIDCEIQTVTIHSAPRFKGISYAWGASAFEMKQEPGRPPEFLEPPIPPAIVDRVFVNKRTIPINRNLFVALQCLHRDMIITSDTWLWADALCINQTDSNEKAQQVGLLHKFFPAAEEVLIWLGQSDHGDYHEKQLAIFIGAFEAALTRVEESVGLQRLISSSALQDEEVMQAFQIENLQALIGDTLLLVTRQRWFHRLWCSQEFATARHPRMFYGTAELEPRRLMSVCKVLYDLPWEYTSAHLTNLDLDGTHWAQGIVRIGIVFTNYSEIPDWGKPWASEFLREAGIEDKDLLRKRKLHDSPRIRGLMLSWILQLQARGACLDARDKVFGSQGLIEGLLGDNARFIYPDYSAAVESVFERLSQGLLLHSKTLDVLAFGEGPMQSRQHSSLATWAVDYRGSDHTNNSSNMQACLNVGNGLRSRLVFQQPTLFSRLTFSRQVEVPFNVSNARLQCHGISLDRVEIVPDREFLPDERKDDYGYVLHALEFIQLHIPPRSSSRPVDALWRTLCFNIQPGSRDVAKANLGDYFWCWAAKCTAVAPQKEFEHLAPRFETLVSSLSPETSPDLLACAEILNIFQSFCRYFRDPDRCRDGDTWPIIRDKPQVDPGLKKLDYAANAFKEGLRHHPRRTRLFVTSKGALGTARQTVQPGDELWFLKSATHPWLLRPTHEARVYTFVGLCFVLPGQFELPTPQHAQELTRTVTLI